MSTFNIQARDNGAATFDIRGMSGTAYLETLSETLTLTDLADAKYVLKSKWLRNL